MRLIFMGSPEQVIEPFDRLRTLCSDQGHELLGVVSQPARPAGRKKRLTDPPLASHAKSLGIKVWQPEKSRSKEFVQNLEDLRPDLIITAAYGQILSDDFLAVPRLGTINVHPSLLPLYRGATPVQTALFDGHQKTGVTILFTVKALDAGNIICQQSVDIKTLETSDVLMSRLFKIGGELLPLAFEKLSEQGYKGTEQDPDQVTKCHKFDKSSGHIDWNLPTIELVRRFQAFKPWPGSYAFLGGKRILFDEIRLVNSDLDLKAREFTYVRNLKTVIVKTSDGFIDLIRVKPEGSKLQQSSAFWNGLKIADKGIFDE